MRSDEVKTANLNRELILRVLTKMKGSRQCRIKKRAFEMVNTIACLYDYENNPVERENLRIQKDGKIE